MAVDIQEATRIIRWTLRSRFREADLLDALSTPTLSMQGQNFIVEILFRDPTRQREVERVLKSVQDELREKGIGLNVVSRALWRVQNVVYVGPARSADGGLKAALRFSALVISGRDKQEILVDLSIAALEVVRQKLQLEPFYGLVGWSPQAGDVPKELLEAVVSSFLNALLNGGLSSSYDLSDTIDVRRGELEILFGMSTAFSELKNAVDDILSIDAGRSNLDAKAKRFDDLVPELANFLGGAYKSGQTFVTSSQSLFEQLRPAEQDLLKAYYRYKTAPGGRTHSPAAG